MTKEIILIRHAKTFGNLEGRYIGQRTDEDILAEEYGQLELIADGLSTKLCKPGEDAENFTLRGRELYVSPLRRSISTLENLFPFSNYTIVDELKEIDFGDFEGHNFRELSDDPYYQRWIDSNGELPFPNGESREIFSKRTVEAFKRIVASSDSSQIIICAHGGSIMAILSFLTGQDYYDFQVKNLDGYRIVVDINEEKIDVKSYHSLTSWLYS